MRDYTCVFLSYFSLHIISTKVEWNKRIIIVVRHGLLHKTLAREIKYLGDTKTLLYGETSQ